MKKGICCLLVVFWLAGCANMNDQTKTKAQGAGFGAAAGAAAGAIAGYLLDGEKGAIKGAGLGAAAGGIGGYFYGNHVANQKQKYADKEKWLDDCIAEAEAVNSQTRAYNQRLEREIYAINQEVLALKAEYRSKRSKTASYQKREKNVLAIYEQAQKNLKRAQGEVTIQKQALASARNEQKISKNKIKQMETEIANLERSVQELDRTTQQLAGSVNQLPT